jgi:hypothetical protein
MSRLAVLAVAAFMVLPLVLMVLAAGGETSPLAASTAAAPTALAQDDIPADYLAWYQAAATRSRAPPRPCTNCAGWPGRSGVRSTDWPPRRSRLPPERYPAHGSARPRTCGRRCGKPLTSSVPTATTSVIQAKENTTAPPRTWPRRPTRSQRHTTCCALTPGLTTTARWLTARSGRER